MKIGIIAFLILWPLTSHPTAFPPHKQDLLNLFIHQSENDYTIVQKSHQTILSESPQNFSTQIYLLGKSHIFKFEKTALFSPHLVVSSSLQGSLQVKSKSLVYRAFNRATNSLAVLNVGKNSIHLNISFSNENLIIRKTDTKKYILEYPQIRDRSSYECSTSDDEFRIDDSQASTYKSDESVTLNVYIEIDHSLFMDNDSDLTTTMNWVSLLFSQVAAIYSIHNIQLLVSEVRIWDHPDPYIDTYGLDNLLTLFGQTLQNDFNGDVAQLLSSRPLGGGRANLDQLCQEYNPAESTGPYCIGGNIEVTDAHSSDYTFSTFVTAHEIGHVIGSPHTHACLWGPNQSSALDNCFATEGGCPKGPQPTNGGTIMSYCFLKSDIGINYTNGFGDEPGALVYNKILNAQCNSSNCVEGNQCDDEDDCTTNDRWDENCNCLGDLIDHNLNEICDLTESCAEIVNIDTISTPTQAVLASNMIMSSSFVSVANGIVYSAGQGIQLHPGFEVPFNTALEVYNNGCLDSN